ncbi:hypothetical protein GCM10027280_35260 [Micromonospora polyrhachis]|uniref:Putative membrane protein n=1 Tax=Micromonospora polyrhachis TaxID=1282883 RepID=A0A7W7SR36_9ACTN|nr:PH domain-containing protein [Micromonospora polyrhachis]MBB4959399.1 putative membrane protein [Micromonospora polyrhachis]
MTAEKVPADEASGIAAAAEVPDRAAKATKVPDRAAKAADSRAAVEDDPHWLPLHRDSLKVTALLTAGGAFSAGVPTVIGVASATSWTIALAWVLPATALLTAAVTAFDALRLRVTRYRMTEGRLEMNSGLLFKRHRSFALERIRSVDLSAHPLLRAFGLVNVKVGTGETGSGSGSSTEQSLVLDPVGRAEGERLRAELLRRSTVNDGTTNEQRLTTWKTSWVRYGPLSFGTPLLAAALVGGIFQLSDWFGRGGLPVEIVADLVDRYGPWRVFGIGVVAFVVAGAIGSLAVQAEAYWNHRLDREPGGTLRVQRGLLVARSLSLEEQRIRGIEIVEPIGIRSASAARLDVIAIGLKTDEPGSDLSTLVPAAPRDVILAAAAAVRGPLGSAELVGHPRTARTRRLRWAGVVALVIATVVALAHLLWSMPTFWSSVIVIVAALLAIGAGWLAVDAYAALGHALEGKHLVARQGSVRRSTVYLDRAGIIGWRISQSVFQRRLGLMTLDATTAAGRGHYAVIDADAHTILDFADAAVPGLLAPFLERLPEPTAQVSAGVDSPSPR